MIASIHCIQGLFCLSLRLGYSRYIGFSTPCLLGKCRTFGNRKLSWNFRLIFGPIQQKPIGQCANVGGWIIGCMEFLTVDGTLEPSASPSPPNAHLMASPPHTSNPNQPQLTYFFVPSNRLVSWILDCKMESLQGYFSRDASSLAPPLPPVGRRGRFYRPACPPLSSTQTNSPKTQLSPYTKKLFGRPTMTGN